MRPVLAPRLLVWSGASALLCVSIGMSSVLALPPTSTSQRDAALSVGETAGGPHAAGSLAFSGTGFGGVNAGAMAFAGRTADAGSVATAGIGAAGVTAGTAGATGAAVGGSAGVAPIAGAGGSLTGASGAGAAGAGGSSAPPTDVGNPSDWAFLLDLGAPVIPFLKDANRNPESAAALGVRIGGVFDVQFFVESLTFRSLYVPVRIARMQNSQFGGFAAGLRVGADWPLCRLFHLGILAHVGRASIEVPLDLGEQSIELSGYTAAGFLAPGFRVIGEGAGDTPDVWLRWFLGIEGIRLDSVLNPAGEYTMRHRRVAFVFGPELEILYNVRRLKNDQPKP